MILLKSFRLNCGYHKRIQGIWCWMGKPSIWFLCPWLDNDSIKGLELVKIYSSQYNTEKGISTSSTLKDVADNYSIDKIEPSFSAAILFIDEINATISLNKEDLKLDEFNMNDISIRIRYRMRQVSCTSACGLNRTIGFAICMTL